MRLKASSRGRIGLATAGEEQRLGPRPLERPRRLIAPLIVAHDEDPHRGVTVHAVGLALEPIIEPAHVQPIQVQVSCRPEINTAELSAAGVPSILVPYPFAVDDHQTANARFLGNAGAAIVIQEKDLTKEYLCRLLCNFSESRQKLETMGKCARTVDKPDATRVIATLCLEVIHAG